MPLSRIPAFSRLAGANRFVFNKDNTVLRYDLNGLTKDPIQEIKTQLQQAKITIGKEVRSDSELSFDPSTGTLTVLPQRYFNLSSDNEGIYHYLSYLEQIRVSVMFARAKVSTETDAPGRLDLILSAVQRLIKRLHLYLADTEEFDWPEVFKVKLEKILGEIIFSQDSNVSLWSELLSILVENQLHQDTLYEDQLLLSNLFYAAILKHWGNLSENDKEKFYPLLEYLNSPLNPFARNGLQGDVYKTPLYEEAIASFEKALKNHQKLEHVNDFNFFTLYPRQSHGEYSKEQKKYLTDATKTIFHTYLKWSEVPSAVFRLGRFVEFKASEDSRLRTLSLLWTQNLQRINEPTVDEGKDDGLAIAIAVSSFSPGGGSPT